jgi:hypothetical protein
MAYTVNVAKTGIRGGLFMRKWTEAEALEYLLL